MRGLRDPWFRWFHWWKRNLTEAYHVATMSLIALAQTLPKTKPCTGVTVETHIFPWVICHSMSFHPLVVIFWLQIQERTKDLMDSEMFYKRVVKSMTEMHSSTSCCNCNPNSFDPQLCRMPGAHVLTRNERPRRICSTSVMNVFFRWEAR